MREITLSRPGLSEDAASFLACVATILELPEADVPDLSSPDDPSTDWNLLGWLGSLGVGLVAVAAPNEFAWPGPWIARVQAGDGKRRSVVMYGRSPSGVVWDPAGGEPVSPEQIQDGFVIAAEDIALGMPLAALPAAASGAVEQLWVAAKAGEPGRALQSVEVVPGVGLAGDRYLNGEGTFPSGRPGSALTLIEAEVCETFHPRLELDEHRRNVVTRGVGLNGMVGQDFMIGPVRCRGVRLCEPCATTQRYADRPILRALVHRGGLRADVLEAGEISVGDSIVPVAEGVSEELLG